MKAFSNNIYKEKVHILQVYIYIYIKGWVQVTSGVILSNVILLNIF